MSTMVTKHNKKGDTAHLLNYESGGRVTWCGYRIRPKLGWVRDDNKGNAPICQTCQKAEARRERRQQEAREKFMQSLNEVGLSYNHERMAYFMDYKAKEMYTVFTKFPGEDFYAEEIDVLVNGFGPGARGEAMEIARRVIKWGFDPKLYPVKVVHRPKGVMFF